MMNLNGVRVAITGGTGTFGRALARRILENQRPGKLIVFSRGEHAQAAMREDLAELNEARGNPLRFRIGDIRDAKRVKVAISDASCVFHAAAMKRIEACEANPQEAIATNIIGSQNLVHAAIECGVQRVLAISTDKSAAPATLYGATKLAMERTMVASNVMVRPGGTRFSVARYGNVIGSAGSVLPLFCKLLSSDDLSLPVTDPKMTRFFWSPQDAADFALGAMGRMDRGEVFIPYMQSVSVGQIVLGLRKLTGLDISPRIIGPRQAEKVHEILIGEDEAPLTYKDTEFMAICPHGPPQWVTSSAGGYSAYSSGDADNTMAECNFLRLLQDYLESEWPWLLPQAQPE